MSPCPQSGRCLGLFLTCATPSSTDSAVSLWLFGTLQKEKPAQVFVTMGFTVLCVMVEREIPQLLQNMLWYGLHAASEGETPSFRESLSTDTGSSLGRRVDN